MSIIESPNLLLCGLPNSGKSTFVAAISYLLEHGESITEISYNGPAQDTKYIQRLSELWASCEEIGRTQVQGKEDVKLNLSLSGENFTLDMPDLDGEKWRDLWVKRHCDAEISDLSIDASGILFFININKITPPLSIQTVKDSLNAVLEEEPSDKNASLDASSESELVSVQPVEWEAEGASTQSILVDLLQSLSGKDMSQNIKPLAVILSAWDDAEEGLKPLEVLNRELPLLAQYLNSGLDFPEWSVFGVSAQGGNVADEAVKQELLAKEDPSERIIVECESQRDNDLSRPLSWLVTS